MFKSFIKFLMPTWFYNWVYGKKVDNKVFAAVRADDRDLSALATEAAEVDAAIFEVLTEKQTIIKSIQDAETVIATTKKRCQEQQLTPAKMQSLGFSALIREKEEVIAKARLKLKEIEDEEELKRTEQEVVVLSAKRVVQNRTFFLSDIGRRASSDNVLQAVSTISAHQTDIETAVDDADNLYSIAVANNRQANKDDPAAQVGASALISSYRGSLNQRDRLRRQASQSALVEVDESINRLNRVKAIEELYTTLNHYHVAITEDNKADKKTYRKAVHQQASELHRKFKRLEEKSKHEVELTSVLASLESNTEKPLHCSKQEKISKLDSYLDSISALVKKMRGESLSSSPSLTSLTQKPSARSASPARKALSSPGRLAEIQAKLQALESDKIRIEAEIAQAQEYVDKENDSSQLSAEMQSLIREKGRSKLEAESRLGKVIQDLQLLKAQERLLLLSQRKSSQDLLRRSADTRTVANVGFLGTNRLTQSAELNQPTSSIQAGNDSVARPYYSSANDWM